MYFFDHDKSNFISQLIVANQEISKCYSNILMEQQLLRLMYCYHLLCSLSFLSYIQRFSSYGFVVIYFITIIISFISRIIYFVFIITINLHNTSLHNPPDAIGNYTSNRSCIDNTISRSSALFINVLLVFDMHDLMERYLWRLAFYFLLYHYYLLQKFFFS